MARATRLLQGCLEATARPFATPRTNSFICMRSETRSRVPSEDGRKGYSILDKPSGRGTVCTQFAMIFRSDRGATVVESAQHCEARLKKSCRKREALRLGLSRHTSSIWSAICRSPGRCTPTALRRRTPDPLDSFAWRRSNQGLLPHPALIEDRPAGALPA
jgi:hypothetical protein